MTSKARRVMTALFEAFLDDPGLMPEEHSATAARLEPAQGAAAAPAPSPITSPA